MKTTCKQISAVLIIILAIIAAIVATGLIAGVAMYPAIIWLLAGFDHQERRGLSGGAER